MDPLDVGVVGLVAILILVVLGVRVAFAAGAVGLTGLVYMRGWAAGTGIAGTIPHSESTHYTLSVLPMFILIGYLAYYAGITRGLFEAARRWFSWAPGGLAVGTIFAAAGFAAVSGASTATAAVFARIAIPEMLRFGYNRSLAAAVVAAGGTLASLIPPSAILVIYGVIVEQSVGRLLLAGFIPGAISAVIYAAAIVGRVLINPEMAPPVEQSSWSERFASLKGIWGIVFVIGVILGGIYLGWMTPTETGAAGAMIIFIMALARREMSLHNFHDALMETAKLTAMIFTVVWSILIFVRFLGYAGLPEAFAEWIVNLPLPRLAILIMILGIYFVLGMFMDGIGMLILTLPVVYPAVVGLGYDPIWFGIILVKLVEICLLTPPVGLNCFVVNGVRPDIPLHDVFRGVYPFVIADLLCIALFTAFPQIVLFLPNTMLGR